MEPLANSMPRIHKTKAFSASTLTVETVLALILLAACLAILGCIFQGCGEELKAEAASPDGKVVATVWERNCGATTSFIAHVNLRPSNEAFREDSDGVIKEGQVFVIRGPGDRIKLVWQDPRRLVI